MECMKKRCTIVTMPIRFGNVLECCVVDVLVPILVSLVVFVVVKGGS